MAASKNLNKPVKVVWEDAWTSGGRYTQEEINRTQPLLMDLYGLCVRDDKAGITITMEKAPKEGNYRCIWFVPRAMVKKVTVLK